MFLVTVVMSLMILSVLNLGIRFTVGATRGYKVRARIRALAESNSAPRTIDASEISVASAAAARLLAGKIQSSIGICFLLIVLATSTSDLPRSRSLVILGVALVVTDRLYQRWPARVYNAIVGYETRAFSWTSFRYKVVNVRIKRVFFVILIAAITGSIGIVACSLFLAHLLSATGEVIGPLAVVLPPGASFGPAGNAISCIVIGATLVVTADWLDRHARRRAMFTLGADLPPVGRIDSVNVLFLREFGREAQSVLTTTSTDQLLMQRVIPRWRTLLEDCLTWFCWADGPVVSVGDPRRPREKTLGSRMFVGGEWESAVETLANAARFIILVCGSNDGIRWETKLVRSRANLLRKTVFINSAPLEPDLFLGELALAGLPITSVLIPKGLTVVGAIHKERRLFLLTSTAAADVDYESAVQRALIELGMSKRRRRWMLSRLVVPKFVGLINVLRR